MSDAKKITEEPTDARGRVALPKVRNAWYIACESHELGKEPLPFRLFGTPLVLFRNEEGKPSALLDRCAHRNVPLSLGRNCGGQMECAYHGWRFDGDGVCRLVPALCGPQEGKARRVPSFPAREQQGYVWVWAEPRESDSPPEQAPFVFPCLDDDRYQTVRYSIDIEATLYSTLENILDVPHTAFLHRGLFRSGPKNRIAAVVRRAAENVEAEFVGEPRPTGIAAKLLAPQGGTIKHFDRFILPSIAQVDYALGDSSHLMISNAVTPIEDFLSRMNAVISLRLPVGASVVRRLVTPLAKRIAAQDASMLKRQTETIKHFNGEQFVSTEVDLLGPHILRLLRQAERKDKPSKKQPADERVDLLT